MAEIRDVKLTVEPVAGNDARWLLAVEFSVRFPYWEKGTYVTERVEIRSARSSGGPLAIMESSPWPLDPGESGLVDGQDYVVKRGTPKWAIGPDVPYENGESIYVANEPRHDRWVGFEDGVFARVTLTPKAAVAHEADSDTVKGQFGP